MTTPRTIATCDLIVELAARTVEDNREHGRTIDSFLRLLRVVAMHGSLRQRQQAAETLRNAADELDAAPVTART
jgi:hypothetical protein